MARFSTTFALSNSQANLDFVDIDTSTDTHLYLDPYAIQIREDEWSGKCGDHIRSFFAEVLAALRTDNMAHVRHLLSHLHEPNETYLGVSRGRASGRGVGPLKAAQLADAIKNSRAFATGLLGDISEAELFIYGVGSDTISDLTTNVLRGPLASYTAEQCALHSIETSRVTNIGPVWNMATCDWESQPLQLPTVDRRPVLLVPKFSVRQRLSLDSQEFYNHHMIEFLRQEHLAAGSALVKVFKNGRRDVTKISVKKLNPFVKDDLAKFVRNHPEVLDSYKQLRGAEGPLSIEDLEKFFDEAAFAHALIESLSGIPSGGDAAAQYHSLCVGICTFLFHPYLICPVKEREIHEGRKRLDIKYSNAATSGFFHSMIASPQARALIVSVECKNYTNQIRNPELDQLSGRFGHQRGFFGILLCRNLENRGRIIQSCRDTASDQRGFILVFEDQDIIEMLQLVASGNRQRIQGFLHERFDEIAL